MSNISGVDNATQRAWIRTLGFLKERAGCPWLSLQGWHCVRTIVCSTLTRTEGSEVSHWPNCFLSSWGMFTEVWCFSKPFIRSTPCPPYLYFSEYVERTLCFCFFASIPKCSCRCEFHGSLWEGKSVTKLSMLQYCVQVLHVTEVWLYRHLKTSKL